MIETMRLRVWSWWLRIWMVSATWIWLALLYFEAFWAYFRGNIPSFWHIGPAVAARVKFASDQMNQGQITPAERRIMERAIAKRARKGKVGSVNLEEKRKKRATLTIVPPSATLDPPDTKDEP